MRCSIGPTSRSWVPVSYGLETHDKVDWINTGESGSSEAVARPNPKLLLLGGCDLLQLASYCSTDRLEFVNFAKEGERLRFDDPNFVLTDRALLRDCKVIREFPWWSYEGERSGSMRVRRRRT